MKRLKKLLRLIIIIGILFFAYKLFFTPVGYTNDVKLANDFFVNISDNNACDNYFSSETQDLCTAFQDMLSTETFDVTSVVSKNQTVLVTITNGDSTVTYTLHFTRIEATGPSHYIFPYYYLIDYIE